MRFTPSGFTPSANIGPSTETGRGPVSIPDYSIVAPSIPESLHQIWLGGKPLPARWAGFADRLRALHPDWEYRLWTDADLPALWDADPFLQSLNLAAIFALWRNYGYQSDIVRLALLWLHGGIYLDTDCEVFRPLGPLAFGCDAFVGATFPGEPFPQVLIQNAVLGACPRHPWLTLTLTRLSEGLAAATEDTRDGAVARHRVKSNLMNILDLTGPGLLSRTLTEYRALPASLQSDVRVVPARFLFPAGPDKPQSPEQYRDALLLHRWDNSWGKPPEH